MTWDPTLEPKTWQDYSDTTELEDDPLPAADVNDERDQTAYIKGALPFDGHYIKTTATAIVGAVTIDVDPDTVAEDVPIETPLYFQDANAWALLTATAEAGADLLNVEPLLVEIPEGDVAPWPKQTAIEIDALTLEVANGVAAGLEHPALEHKHQTSGGGSSYVLTAVKSSGALADNDYSEIVLGLMLDDGTEEPLVMLRAYRSGAVDLGTIHIFTRTGGGWNATPVLTIRHTNRVMANGLGPNYTFDIDGDLDLTGDLIGATLWRESPTGTLLHPGSARVTGQLVSTLATGTAPMSISGGAKMVENLNVPLLNGREWPDAPTDDDGTATVATAGTEYTVASDTTGAAAWLYTLRGEVEVDVAANDVGAQFLAYFKVGGTVISVRQPPVRAASAKRIGWCVTGQAEITAGATVNLIVKKTAGTGSSAAVGSFSISGYGVS